MRGAVGVRENAGMTDTPELQVTWTDPDSGVHGFLTVDRLIGGLGAGGLRMRPGGTLRESADLAATMTLKLAVHDLPVGGAKGVIDADPHDPASQGVLERYVEAMRPLLDSRWATAEDLGVSQERLNAAFARVFAPDDLPISVRAAVRSRPDPEGTLRRVRAALDLSDGGIALADLTAGYGAVEAAAVALEHRGGGLDGAAVVVHGFGATGGAAARFLARRGARVVAVADADGVVASERGVDVEALLALRNPTGEVDRDRLPGDHDALPRAAWTELDCDLLIPASISYLIDEDSLDHVRAPVVVELANNPVTEKALPELEQRGVLVVPDFVANSGAAAWWWWLLLGELDAEVEPAYERIAASMRQLVAQVLHAAETTGLGARAAAVDLARRKLAERS